MSLTIDTISQAIESPPTVSNRSTPHNLGELLKETLLMIRELIAATADCISIDHQYWEIPGLSRSDRQLLSDVYPDGLDTPISQRIRDCWLAGPLASLKAHPFFPYIFCKVITNTSGGPESRKSWMAELVDLENRNHAIHLDNTETHGSASHPALQGALGDRIIERAVGKLIQQTKRRPVVDVYKETNPQKSTMANLELGQIKYFLQVFVGKYAKSHQIPTLGIIKHMSYQDVLKLAAIYPEKYILTAVDTIHVYGIIKVDLEKNEITYVDPVDTSIQKKLNISHMPNKFTDLTLVDLQTGSIEEDFGRLPFLQNLEEKERAHEWNPNQPISLSKLKISFSVETEGLIIKKDQGAWGSKTKKLKRGEQTVIENYVIGFTTQGRLTVKKVL